MALLDNTNIYFILTGNMFKKLSGKSKKDKAVTKGKISTPTDVSGGGAVPYNHDLKTKTPPAAGDVSNGDGIHGNVKDKPLPRNQEQDGAALIEAAFKGDFDGVRKLRRSKVNINWLDKVRRNNNYLNMKTHSGYRFTIIQNVYIIFNICINRIVKEQSQHHNLRNVCFVTLTLIIIYKDGNSYLTLTFIHRIKTKV